jgi:ParB family chromosome partitioning protein
VLHQLLEPVDAISQHPDNANNGDLEEITQSLMINGMYRPIIAHRATGHIVSGNNLYAACLGLGMDRVPVAWTDDDTDEAGAVRILVGDNQIARLARIDEYGIRDLLRILEQSELGLLGTGFADETLPDLDDGPLNLDPPSAQVHATYTCPHCGHQWSNGRDD